MNLEDLAIQSQTDKDGVTTWTIRLSASGSDDKIRTARFDPIERTWHVLTDEEHNHDAELNDTPRNVARQSIKYPRLDSPGKLAPDWSKTLVKSPHTDFIRQFDWSSTDIGPLFTWPLSLQVHIHMLLLDPRCAAIYWGPKRTAIYNERSIPVMWDLHPRLMGKTFEVVMPHLWDVFGPNILQLEASRGTFVQRGFEIPLLCDDHLVESWWDGAIYSLPNDSGTHGGTYFSWTECSQLTIDTRWTAMINSLKPTSLIEGDSTWDFVIEKLTAFPRDISMAAIYAVGHPEEDLQRVQRMCTIGIPPEHPGFPEIINLAERADPASIDHYFKIARESPRFIAIDASEPEADFVLKNDVVWSSYGEPSRTYIAMALKYGDDIKAYVFLGLNARRSFTETHKQHVGDLDQQLQKLVQKVWTDDENRKRACLLGDQLTEYERHLNKVAETAPCGIYELDHTGTLLWANSRFFDIMHVPLEKRQFGDWDWKIYVVPEDWDRSVISLALCTQSNTETSDTVMLHSTWLPPNNADGTDPTPQPVYVKYATIPDHTASRSALGYIIDVSHEKWAERLQQDAVIKAERKRLHLEEFIDVVSHEMRNPLSAVIQSSDSIVSTLDAAQKDKSPDALIEIIESNVQAAEAILFCAQHQKRIIDDVLTLGKLDAEGSALEFNAFQPKLTVMQAVQMFQSEIESAKIELDEIVDEDSPLNPSALVYGDSNRLLQVIINLLTNAIKFTRTQEKRRITVRSGLSVITPEPGMFGSNFAWSSIGSDRPSAIDGLDAQTGKQVHWYFAISDTGQGVSPEMTHNVFSKFDQGDRRTYVKYGGSGLGLYISRELCELHGGRIGIQSEQGIGSTFAFFVKVKQEPELTQIASSGTVPAHRPIVQKTMSTIEIMAANPLISKIDILLVEDNLLNQKVLKKQLEKTGCTVISANHGGEAIDLVLHGIGQPPRYGSILPSTKSDRKICVVLMDWEMPVCDGLTATRALREIESHESSLPPLKIIGITANARDEQRRMAMDAGMDAVLTKPFRISEVLAQISQLLP